MKNIIIVVLSISSLAAFSQSIDKTKLDNYFETLEKNNKFMGSVAVSRNGKLIYTKSMGYSFEENRSKANENTKYRIGSISKTFTAVLVFKAIEEKKLSIDQTIASYFPTIKNAEKITINELLYHRSGIHDFTTNKNYFEWNTSPKTEAQMIDTIAKSGIDFEPDTKPDYSNSNFVLLSIILERIYNKPYADLLTDYILKPAGLKNTSFGGKINFKKNEAGSYVYTGKWEMVPGTDLSIPLGAGGICSTPSDLVKFCDALFNGKIISAKSVEEMKVIRDEYGRGLYQTVFDSKTGYGHTGGIDGFVSVFNYFPDEKVAYSVISNGVNYDLKALRTTLLDAIFLKPITIPEFYKPDIEELNGYAGNYSSDKIPVKITIKTEGSILMCETQGNPAFPLDPTEKNKFRFERAGISMEFNPAEKTMLLIQGNQQMIFTKDK